MVDVTDMQVKFRLSRSMAKVVKMMFDDGRITASAIENDHRIVTDAKVLIHKIRRRLEAYGITVHSRPNVGYWMDDASKAALLKALDDEAPAGHAGDGEDTENALGAPLPVETDHTP